MSARILVLAETYLPGYLAGGPVRSLASLVEHLGTEFDWSIITADRDYRAAAPYPGIVPDRWLNLGQARVFYASASTRRPSAMLKAMRGLRFDLLYLNSFFSPVFSIVPTLLMRGGLISSKPVLLAPRGEFSPRARALKAWKKLPYVALARHCGLYSGVAWHATSQTEAEDIAQAISPPQGAIFRARNLSAARPAREDARQARPPGSPLRVVFLARIARMKNLDFALRVLRRVSRPVTFTVFGPAEDAAYWAQCQALAATLPAQIRFNYRGPVPNDRVAEAMAAQELFFLPSGGENFGHALVEAWAAGLPVLTSDRTPWRGLGALGVGWDLALDDEAGFAALIDEVAQWPEARHRSSRARCLEFAARQLAADDALAEHRAMFTSVLSRRYPGA